MRFPSIAVVADAIYGHAKFLKNNFSDQDLREYGEDFCGGDVRLQVYEDGDWALRTGSSDYDQDHRGIWGCGAVPRVCTRQEAREIARDLIDQCRQEA